MRTCETYEAWLSALLDGELDPKYQAELMEHLAGCPACRQYFDDIMAIQDALSEPDEEKAPEGFARSVLDAVANTPQDGGAPPAPRRKKSPAPGGRGAARAAGLAQAGAVGWRWTAGLGMGGSMASTAVNDSAAPRSGEAAPQDVPPAARDDCAGAAPEESAMLQDVDGCAPEEPGMAPGNGLASEPTEKRPAGVLTTGCAAARAWVEEQGWTWEPGAEYTLTPAQYEQLLALLEGEDLDLLLEENGDGTCRLTIPVEG